MTDHEQRPASRRAFLRACGRYPILGALALLGGVLVWPREEPDALEPCLKQRLCRNCRELAGCSLPQARAARRQTS